jgi:hypothetical protein
MIYKTTIPGNIYRSTLQAALMLAVVWSCAPVRTAQYEPVVRSVNFYTIGKIPVIRTRLNGKQAHFIVDTGASVSILNEAEASYYGFTVMNSNIYATTEVLGFNGSALTGKVNTCTIEIGDVAIKYGNFRSKNMQDFAYILQKNENIRLAGILGADLMNRYSMSINFMDKTISF